MNVVARDYSRAIMLMEKAGSLYSGQLPLSGKLLLALGYLHSGDPERGRELDERAISELNDSCTYSYWYSIEFRALRAEADQTFIAER